VVRVAAKGFGFWRMLSEPMYTQKDQKEGGEHHGLAGYHLFLLLLFFFHVLLGMYSFVSEGFCWRIAMFTWGFVSSETYKRQSQTVSSWWQPILLTDSSPLSCHPFSISG